MRKSGVRSHSDNFGVFFSFGVSFSFCLSARARKLACLGRKKRREEKGRGEKEKRKGEKKRRKYNVKFFGPFM